MLLAVQNALTRDVASAEQNKGALEAGLMPETEVARFSLVLILSVICILAGLHNVSHPSGRSW